MTEPWVSVDVLAQHLGVTKDSVYRWIERKGLPARKVGKLWKFKLSEVDAWVRAGAANTYIVPKVLDRGYLALGTQRFTFEQGR